MRFLLISILFLINYTPNKINAQSIGETFFRSGYEFRITSLPGILSNGECEIIDSSIYGVIPTDGVVQYNYGTFKGNYDIVGIADHGVETGYAYHPEEEEDSWYGIRDENSIILTFPPKLRYIGAYNFSRENKYNSASRIAIQENVSVSPYAFDLDDESCLKSIYCLSSVNARQFYPNDHAYLIVSPTMLDYYRDWYLAYFGAIKPYGVSAYYTTYNKYEYPFINEVYLKENDEITIAKGEDKTIFIQAFPFKLGNDIQIRTDGTPCAEVLFERQAKYSHEKDKKYNSNCSLCHSDGGTVGTLKIRGTKAGRIVIDIYDSEVKIKSLSVNVIDSYVKNINLDREKLVLFPGESTQLRAIVTPYGASSQVEFKQITTGEQFVDESGLITIPSDWAENNQRVPIKKVEIKAVSTDGSNISSNVLSLTICNLDMMNLSEDSVTLGTGKNHQNELYFNQMQIYDDRIEYQSDDENIAKIISDGYQNSVISGISPGTTNINVLMQYRPTDSGNELLTTFPVEIFQSVEGIRLNHYEVHVPKNNGNNLTYITVQSQVNPSNAKNKDVGYNMGPGIRRDSNGNIAFSNKSFLDAQAEESYIEVYSEDTPEISAICKIYAEDFETYLFDSENSSKIEDRINLKSSQSLKIIPYVNPEYATDRVWNFSSSTPNVADISVDGVITAKNKGKSIINAFSTSSGFILQLDLIVNVYPQISSIELDRRDYNLNVGDSRRILAAVYPEDVLDDSLLWESSDPDIIKILDNDGTIKAVSPGSAIITATAVDGSEVSASCEVTVNPILIESISLNLSEWHGVKDDHFQIMASVFPEDATNRSLSWSSSDDTVAKVDDMGMVTVTGLGECFITVSAIDGSGVSASCKISVEPILVESISLNLSEWHGVKDDHFQIETSVFPEDATNRSLSWSSSDDTVAKVDDMGMVTVTGLGECFITVSAIDGSGVSASCKISVEPILAESLTISPDEFTGSECESFTIVPTILPENADNKELAYSSSNEDVADVNESGMVTIRKVGSTIITVKTTDGSNLEAQCIVSGTSQIDNLFANDSISCDVYDTTGMLLRKDADKEYVDSLSKGIYIIVTGNKVIKLNLTQN